MKGSKKSSRIRILGYEEKNTRTKGYLPDNQRFIFEYINNDIWHLVKRLIYLTFKPLNSVIFCFSTYLKKLWERNDIPWVKITMLCLLVYLLFQKEMQFNFSFNAPFSGLISSAEANIPSVGLQKNVSKVISKDESLGELTKGVSDQQVTNYIKRFAEVAVKEMNKYGIPASIKMGQGIMESSSGKSLLATQSNNHFGIKCRRKCKGCTCRNYADDDVFDMFRVFETDWESWREHSLLLSNNSRYSKLKKHGKDYKKWAAGLQKAGYATDKKYAEKLVRIIEKYKLYKLDNVTLK